MNESTKKKQASVDGTVREVDMRVQRTFPVLLFCFGLFISSPLFQQVYTIQWTKIRLGLDE
jgi:hypothetical protein